MESLNAIKGLAETLKERGYTVNVLQDGRLLLRIGKEAQPGLLAVFGPIEIKDLRAVISLLG